MNEPVAIPQADPRAENLALRSELDAAMRRVVESGRYILGPEVAAFEREFAAYIGVPHAIGVANGTDAITIALRALGIGPGNRVATVSHTAVGTVAGIVACGAEPVFVDIDPATMTMDPNRLEEMLTGQSRPPATLSPGPIRAVVPVHLYGHPADMPAIVEIARRFGLAVVEDCAQAHGAAIAGRRVGSWGDAAAFSFYPTKNLAALGDGGTVLTGDAHVAARCRQLREYGWDAERTSHDATAHSRLDELQAALLRVKLPHLDRLNAARAEWAAGYRQAINRPDVALPACRPNATHAWHQFVIRTPRRDALRAWLQQAGIGTAIHYPRAVHQQPAYARFARAIAQLVATERASAEVLSLPIYSHMDRAALQNINDCVQSCSRSLSTLA